MAEELPVLEELCPRCKGTGTIHECGQRIRCGFCEGAGYTTTEAGDRVLALMRHNFLPMLQDVHNRD